MTDLIPFIIENLGAGNAQGRRLTAAERLDFAKWLFGWLPDNSVFVKNGNGQVGAIRIAPGGTLARIGAGAIGSANSADQRANLGLPALFDAKADRVHLHAFAQAISDIDWSTLQDGRLLARVGGAFVWIDIPAGGGTSGLTNPLGEDLDLNGNALTSGAVEILRVQDGKIYLNGKELIDFDATGASEGEVPRFNADSGKHEGSLPQVGDLAGETPGKWLRVGEDHRVEEVDAPSGGSTSTSGSEYPDGPSQGDSFLRTDALRNNVYRHDLPLKFADADASELNGWISTSERSITVRRDDLDLSAASAYIVGNGYGSGIYFPEATVIRRFSIAFGSMTEGTLQFRVNTANSGLSIKHTIAVASTLRYTEESWIVIPADSLLSLHAASFLNATPEINVEFLVSAFTQVADADPQPA